jgi:hypothetical protein
MSARDHESSGNIPRVPYVTNYRKEIPEVFLYPHYLRPGFRYEDGQRRQTVFLDPALVEVARLGDPGAQIEGLSYVDTIGWPSITGNEESRRAAQVRLGSKMTAEFFQEMLRGELGDETIVLRHIVSGINSHDLSSYREFGIVGDLQIGQEAADVSIATPTVSLEAVTWLWEERN